MATARQLFISPKPGEATARDNMEAIDSSATGVVILQEPPVLYISLNRPERGNALTYMSMEAIGAAAHEAAGDPRYRALVIQGAEGSFSVGEDVGNLGPWPDRLRGRAPRGSQGPADLPQQEMLTELRQFPKPAIAVMEGPVLGLALDIAAVCDIRVCDEHAIIGDDRILRAESPSSGITYTLPRLIGLSQAMRILLLGEFINGREAERIGLVYGSYPTATFHEKLRSLIEKVSNLPTRAYGIVKQQVVDELDMSYKTALMYSMGIRQTNVIKDREEGHRAFIEKRAPRFRGE